MGQPSPGLRQSESRVKAHSVRALLLSYLLGNLLTCHPYLVAYALSKVSSFAVLASLLTELTASGSGYYC